MNRTITALFDSRDDAERAQTRLRTAGVTSANITAQGQGYGDEAAGASNATAGVGHGAGTTTAAEPVTEVTEGSASDAHGAQRSGGGGMWASLKGLFSDDDRSTYEEGLRRGHFLLTAQVDDDRADEAVRILEDSEAVDVDQKTQQWRSAGWTGGQSAEDRMQGKAGDDTLRGAQGDDLMRDYGTDKATRSSDDKLQGIVGDDTLRGTQGDDLVSDRTAATAGSDRLASEGAEQSIPIVEEQLQVGKREVGRGGVRVRSYVSEQPVTEQVSLREEHVNVERRPVDQPVSTAQGDIFQDRTIELTETVEEVVVAKEARVTEELVLNRSVDQHTETVSDTVRHTEVDVERLSGESDEAYRARVAGRSASGTASTV